MRFFWRSDVPPSCAATLQLKTEQSNAHSMGINSVAFSPDGKAVVSGSDDSMVKVWDAGACFHMELMLSVRCSTACKRPFSTKSRIPFPLAPDCLSLIDM